MASLQGREGRWQCQFLYRGKRRTFALGRVTEAEAKSKSDQVDYLLMRLGQGLITLPPGADIVAFVRHDGSIPTSAVEVPRDTATLASLRDRYLETHGNGTLEAHTLRGINRRFKHLARELGGGSRSAILPWAISSITWTSSRGRRGDGAPSTRPRSRKRSSRSEPRGTGACG